MRFGTRIWLFTESLRLATAEIVIFAGVLGGLWCLLAVVTSLRQKARRANGRW
jgi:hypothetical protein